MKKTISTFLKIGLLIFGISFFTIEGAILFSGFSTSHDEQIDYVIILGARLYGTTPSPALTNRLNSALTYLTAHPSTSVIVTGGQGPDEDCTEAQASYDYLVAHGIAKKRILMETTSTTTFENIRNATDIIRKQTGSESVKVLISTNRFHCLRAELLVKRCGLTAYSLPSKTPPSITIPCYLREYFAIIKSFFLDTPTK